ncbi:putative methylcrotonoyl-CoA carboxylase beta chain, mitochondrial [Colletotrichum tanaceti]|uniref:Putative methylcrotonoyl-CoA carboxylase beta chain, mitochondrial n=1 Tax=Colletotrichum tanaceti TaxID=1306861 RepID=A0A4U6XR33_9PEZI|nr:putative methylcrotonoyl-CoA carboxylase beta chain, mitochondrial [Colletotrichum tanaceti]TKW58297.1 putative methylcrotonoyl-CoA carboxylase beta chain, mitochondrial [Colletotrichum tanaceti]
MATSETLSAEELDGAKVHATATGLADQIALDEFDAIRKAREWAVVLRSPIPAALPAPPRYSKDDIVSLVNKDIQKPFNMSKVLLRLVDDTRISIFKLGYGLSMLTAWADILGRELD